MAHNIESFKTKAIRPARFGSLIARIFALVSIALFIGFIPAPAAANPFAYVTNFGSNTVSVIDTATNAVVATVPVGAGPGGLAVTPDGAFVYVANRFSSNISVIDTATNTVVATAPLGLEPRGVAVTPDGAFVYVANANSNTVSVIATATNTVVATVPVGTRPFSVAVTPDGAFVYVANAVSNIVSVIATATNTVVATVPVGSLPFGVAVTPDGAFVYVANQISGFVSVIDTATNTVVATVPVGIEPIGVAVTPDGALVYVANLSSNTVSVIDTATNTVVATVPLVGGRPLGLAVTPDGAFAYVTDLSNNTVAVIDTATNTVAATVGVGSSPFDVAITPSSVVELAIDIEQADIRFDAGKAKKNRMKFRGQIDLGAPFGPEDVVVDIDSDTQPKNAIDPVTIPAAAFVADGLGNFVAEINDPSQQPLGAPLELEVTIPQSGVGEFKVQTKNVDTDVGAPPVDVTLILEVGTTKRGEDMVLEVEKKPGKRLQFKID